MRLGSWQSDSLARTGLAALVVLLLAGCGSSDVGQSLGSRSALLSTLENWAAFQTPVDQALGILTQECMAHHGLPYYPFARVGQPGGEAIFATPTFGSSLWLGPQSMAWRSVNGWGLYEVTMQRLGQPGGFFGGGPLQSQVFRSLRGRAIQRYFTTLYGGGKLTKIRIPGLPGITTQIGGCNTTAGRELFGSIAASVAVPAYGPSILNGTIESSARRDPGLVTSEAEWAVCVKARTGLAVHSPSQLFLHFYSMYNTKGPTPQVHAKELHAAIADLNCQRQTRLPEAVNKAALAAVGKLSPSVLGELQTLLSDLEQARSEAASVFRHAPSSSVSAAQNSSSAPTIGGAASEPGGSVVVSGG